ncbi:uncharacterized protein J8A68_003725 [[Candida] subhashii]|uniref:Uncharacterized protein n=1 Tax=[Candida] subhashii TaxID=561895 RepID=A0A8J5QLX2_9ASCO|nr:uncharacterized protein J8A68_003725 [[Candida] subhashii]KAG7662737.1 hypothetical protein J8A68_003725 [[Candida] subhashii]
MEPEIIEEQMFDDSNIVKNCDEIISTGMTWEQAKDRFEIDDCDTIRVYMKYIIVKHGYRTAFELLENDDHFINDNTNNNAIPQESTKSEPLFPESP